MQIQNEVFGNSSKSGNPLFINIAQNLTKKELKISKSKAKNKSNQSAGIPNLNSYLR